ncbi:MAG: ABC transporter ATP-binding protein [Clostridia bacterium]|nr:ABC transporter ATP-binding protein [Clostridia bacterium]
MSENKYAVEVNDLVVEFKTDEGIVHALNGMDLKVENGKTLGLVGETGAGKTTTALSILRLIPSPPGKIVGGQIKLAGEDLFSKTEDEMRKIRGKAVSMIFQDPMTSLNPVLTVEEQIAEVIELHEDINHAGAIQKAKEMLELVGIPGERGTEFPHQFSGGMKQRVVIAIALACNPTLLIADEPTTALDVTIQAQVLDMMRGLRDKYGTSMIMITHDLGIVAEICDTVAIVYGGRVVEYGTLEDVYNNTRHPYTEGLFNSLPNLDDRAAKLKPIRGLMPDPTNLPEGCTFCDRCDYATEICKTVKPKRVYRNEEHYVECHLYDEESVKTGGKIGK